MLSALCRPNAFRGSLVDVDPTIQVSSLTERAGSPERAMCDAAAPARELASELRTAERVR
jgi:hypothetical protein